MEEAQVSIGRRVDKTAMGHLHNGILFGREKEETFIFCDGIGGP